MGHIKYICIIKIDVFRMKLFCLILLALTVCLSIAGNHGVKKGDRKAERKGDRKAEKKAERKAEWKAKKCNKFLKRLQKCQRKGWRTDNPGYSCANRKKSERKPLEGRRAVACYDYLSKLSEHSCTPLCVATAYCDLKLHNDGTKIGRAQFSTIPGVEQQVKVSLHHPSILDGLHGFHVHGGPVKGENDCLTTGGHYNPDLVNHGGPGGPDSARHVGAFGNVDARSGVVDQTMRFIVGEGTDGNGNYYGSTDRFVLEGERSLVGLGVVLHAGTDDLGLGGDEGSLKTGNAGPRLACCTLE